jgi:hypothetical protein
MYGDFFQAPGTGAALGVLLTKIMNINIMRPKVFEPNIFTRSNTMSDSENNGKPAFDVKAGVDAINKASGTPFFTFFKPYFNFLDKGKLFYVFYIIMAVASLLLPFALLIQVGKAGLFDYVELVGAKLIVAFIFVWLFVVLAGWIGFQLWWTRKSKIAELDKLEFVATPIVSQIFQTFGEWLGTFIGVVGFGAGLFATIILGDSASQIFRYIGLDVLSGLGFAAIIAGPLLGFVIIIATRFLAEQLRIIVSLANNTKEIANNLKK